jgi:hypothetical protein
MIFLQTYNFFYFFTGVLIPMDASQTNTHRQCGPNGTPTRQFLLCYILCTVSPHFIVNWIVPIFLGMIKQRALYDFWFEILASVLSGHDVFE